MTATHNTSKRQEDTDDQDARCKCGHARKRHANRPASGNGTCLAYELGRWCKCEGFRAPGKAKAAEDRPTPAKVPSG